MVGSQQGQDVTPAVIDACRRGDRQAFRVLYEAHKDKVYSMALYFFRGDAATAADVTQHVFLKLMDKMGQFRGQADFSTWLYRFVSNACVDRTRRGWQRETATDPATLDERPAPLSHEEAFARAEVAGWVQAAVADLAPNIRMAIVLRSFEGLSYAEMASALHGSIGTVGSRLSRGHDELARTLANRVGPLAGGRS
jgi:RNA polymerase sigma-70 factor (ECF subfamily)